MLITFPKKTKWKSSEQNPLLIDRIISIRTGQGNPANTIEM